MRKLTLSLAVLAALLPGRAMTLGLGELELHSALNQELNAEIEVLSASPEDAEQLIIKLASRDAFARAGIDRPYMLQQLKFDVVTKGDVPYIKVYTKSPIREPFLSFLVEVDWPEGHLLREYTMLLDPPVFSGGSGGPASTAGSRPFSDPTGVQAQPQSAAPQQDFSRPAESAYMAPQSAASGGYQQQQSLPTTPPLTIQSADTGRQVTYRPMAQYNQVSGDYRVQQNDTLWSVASKLRPDNSITVEQMMLALVRQNPEAFIKENIHGIKRGYILRMPDRAAITAIDRQAAIAQVREHTALWREYRQAMGHGAPASAMESSAGDSSVPMDETGDGKLSILGASGEQGSDTAAAGQDPMAKELKRLRAELSLANESLESERLEKENLKQRLNELEQRVQRALEMDDSELAKLQQDLAGAKQDMEPAPMTEAEPMAEMPAEPMAEPMDQPIAEPMPESGQDETPPMPAEESAEAGQDSVFVDENQPAEPMTDQVEQGQSQVKPPQPVVAPDFQAQPKGFIESLLEDQKMLAVVGGGLAAILVLILLLMRRLRKGKSEEDEWMAGDIDDTDMRDTASFDEPPLVTDATGDVDATAEMPASAFDDRELEQTVETKAVADDLEDTLIGLAKDEESKEEEKDDVLAEADVYLAYGIYQQAEELLSKAIRENPERDDYRMKLLETHFASKDAGAFEALAEEVKQRKGGDRSYWDRVAAMGSELIPGSALFSGAAIAALDTDDLLPKKPQTTDLELDAGDADLDLGGLDSGDDIEATQILNQPLDLDAVAAEQGDSNELDLASDLENIANELDMGEADSAAAPEEDSSLEFDLGEFDDAGMESVADTGSADDLEMDDDFSLDFEASDLGFETSDDTETEDAVAETEAALDLDADLDLGVELEPAADMDEAVGELDLDMGDLGLEDDTDEPRLGDAVADLDLSATDLDLGDTDIDTGDTELDLDDGGLDLDMDIGADLDAGASDDMALDLDGVSVDMDEDVSLDMNEPVVVAGMAADDDDFDIAELSEDIDEVTTKLDLARAYIDMGDNEGARSILQEVQQEGNEEQQAQAAELLQQAS